MSFDRKLLAYFAFGLGLVGALACLAAIVGLWAVNARLRRATAGVFDEVDSALAVVEERTGRARDRVTESVITTETMASSLKEWTQREAGQRLTQQLQVVEKSEQLRVAVAHADDLLATSRASAQLVRQALSMGRAAGAPIDAGFADRLVEEIASLQARLAEASQLVEKLHKRAAAMSEEEVPAELIEQAVQLTLRVVATLGSMDERLSRFEARTLEAKANLQGVKTRTLQWMRWGTVAATLIIIWMAAGQAAMCRMAWKAQARHS